MSDLVDTLNGDDALIGDSSVKYIFPDLPVKEGVLICLPMYAGWCLQPNVLSLIALVRDLEQGGMDYDVVSGSDSAVHRNRYFLTDEFLRSGYSHMLFIDSDIEFTGDDVRKLYEMDTDVAVGPYRLKRDDATLCAYKDGKHVKVCEIGDEPFDVDYAGTGFMLIKRHVFERMHEEGANPIIDTIKGRMPRWWGFDVVDGPHGAGIELPEDYSFCEKVRSLGMRVMMHPGIKLKHWGIKGY